MKKERVHAPPIGEKILKYFYPDIEAESISGDYEVIYEELLQNKGILYSGLWYWIQILRSVLVAITVWLFWRTAIFKYHIRVTLRNLRRNKGYSIINISGLALAIACCILILLWIQGELRYDRYHEHADRIFRLGSEADLGGRFFRVPLSNNPAALTLQEDFPEVIAAARIRKSAFPSVEYKDLKFYEQEIYFADSSLFSVFTIPFISGNPDKALKTAYSIVITEDIAKKIFGRENPIGKVLKLQGRSEFKVDGVVKNMPAQSHFTFNILCSFETLREEQKRQMERWIGFPNYTYLLLSANYDYRELEKKLPAFIDKYMGKDLKNIKADLKFFLQPLTRIHLHSHLEREISANGDVKYVYIFSSIALLILLIACINFMNLSTARSATRAIEVGIKKVLGVSRSNLIRQFLIETFIYCFMGLLLAILVVYLALPLVRTFLGIDIHFNFSLLPWLLPTFFGLTFFIGLVAGSYPALFLSSFPPGIVLKGPLRKGAQNSRFRSILVVAQFTVSIILIIGTGIIFSQLRFMKSKDLGFKKEQVVLMRVPERILSKSFDAIKAELIAVPGIISAAASSIVPGIEPNINQFIGEGISDENQFTMDVMSVDQDYFPTMDMEIVKGRNFSPEYVSDQKHAVILNETAAKRFGWDNPIGKKIWTYSRSRLKADQGKTVIGVVKDFHMISLHRVINPLVIDNAPFAFGGLSVRISQKNIGDTLDVLRKHWKNIDADRPFYYFFLDTFFEEKYKGDENLSQIFVFFTVFAIFIACLGLFGLASFLAEQRTKEIGIRKVLGASTSTVVLLLSKEFVSGVFLANGIAWPVAYYSANLWLQGFAYRTSVKLNIFVLSAGLAVAIALLTVSFRALRAALANPVDSLRYE
jgi:putative ABC transport system permease protein